MHHPSFIIRQQRPHPDVVARQAETTSSSQSPVARLIESSTDGGFNGTTSSTDTSTSLSSSSSSSSVEFSSSVQPSSPPSTSPSTPSSTPPQTSTTTQTESNTSLTESGSTGTSIFRSSPSPSSTPTGSSRSTTSTTSVTSGTLFLTSPPDPTPKTTLIDTQEFSPTSVIGTFTFSPSESATNQSVSGSSKGFWQNTAAVAGVFTSLSLVALGIIIAGFFILRKKRAAARLRREEDYYENFVEEPGTTRSMSGHSTGSPGPSIVDLSTHPPMDVYAGNQAYRLTSVPEQRSEYSNHSDRSMSEQTPLPLASQRQSQHFYVPPPTTRATQPLYGQESSVRTSYQPSLDSFYGAS